MFSFTIKDNGRLRCKIKTQVCLFFFQSSAKAWSCPPESLPPPVIPPMLLVRLVVGVVFSMRWWTENSMRNVGITNVIDEKMNRFSRTNICFRVRPSGRPSGTRKTRRKVSTGWKFRGVARPTTKPWNSSALSTSCTEPSWINRWDNDDDYYYYYGCYYYYYFPSMTQTKFWYIFYVCVIIVVLFLRDILWYCFCFIKSS